MLTSSLEESGQRETCEEATLLHFYLFAESRVRGLVYIAPRTEASQASGHRMFDRTERCRPLLSLRDARGMTKAHGVAEMSAGRNLFLHGCGREDDIRQRHRVPIWAIFIQITSHATCNHCARGLLQLCH